MSFKSGEIKFIDRFQFVAYCIGKLTENLYVEEHIREMSADETEYMKCIEPENYENG